MSKIAIIYDVPFWRRKKTHNRQNMNYRAASEDFPLDTKLWKYNVDAYESDLIEINKNEKNLSKLDPDLNPKQR